MARPFFFSPQAASAVVMVRPHHFTVNTETANDNRFQKVPETGQDLRRRAYDEITCAGEMLSSAGIAVHMFEDEGDKTPDSVFPNNWFSTHAGGHVAIFPMKARNRRLERRPDIIETLKRDYRVQDVIDYSGLEADGLFLEGTGAMVLDHIDRVAYVVRSERADPVALERFATHFNFEPMVFDARDPQGMAIYHTNVLMCIGTGFVLIGPEMMTEPDRRTEILDRLRRTGRDIIALDNDQIARFAGNALELQAPDQRLLALSTTALDALRPDQIAAIEKTASIVALDIPTIENAGGSVRCTLAGIHLARR
ncbi:citrulline utilization hydrolase CtlX [Martelella soudanensis]|uniref:citrulline utilization hydrolase CtlX n=1 Tax=unclassified Martelella TaxID=2629616 RepID=UPI001FEDA589|nr:MULTISPECIES: arginine deiminase-related protein [unclassified Martelella]